VKPLPPAVLLLLGGLEGLDEGGGLLGLGVEGELVELAPADPGALAAEVAAEGVLVDPGGLCEVCGRKGLLGGRDGDLSFLVTLTLIS
jgi:hypothetical protein